MPRVHVTAGADIGMERAAAAAAVSQPEAPQEQGERAEIAGSAVGADAAQGPEAQEGEAGALRKREEKVPLRLQLARARRRAGPGTPAPAWKLEGSPGPLEGDGEAASAAAAAPPAVAAARKSSASATASARQLGASLWEIHDVMREGRRGGARRRRSGRGLATGGVEVEQPLSSGGLGRNLERPSMDHHKLHQERGHAAERFSPASYASSIGDSSIHRPVSPTRSLDIKHRSRGASYNLNTSTELLKVLNRIWSLEEQHASNKSVVKGLRLELQQARAHIHELMQERRGYRHEVASLMRELSEDNIVGKSRDHGNIGATIRSLQDELEDERRLRHRSEAIHKKFSKELSEIKPAFLKAVKDFEKEKKKNRLLEDLCDQFAIGIRNYEEEVSVLKQNHGNNYEHKFDKSVLHISEAWLDERMQLQSMDVQEDLWNKTTVTDRLSNEIQAFLLAKDSSSSKSNDKYMNNGRGDGSLRRQSLESVHLNGATSAPQVADDDDDSVASDLHCFELNMHGNGIQNHDHAGPRRNATGSIDAPKRISEHSHRSSTAGESSHVATYLRKDKTRSSRSKPQHASRAPEINSHSSAGIAPAEEQNEISSAHISQRSYIKSSVHNLEARHADFPGQESLDHYSRTSLFCEGTTSGDLCNIRSPPRQLNCHQSAPGGHEIIECSPNLSVGAKENTLKAKLLQARLEGRHARLKASGGSLSSRRK